MPQKVATIEIKDEGYPSLLKQIFDPPAVLYCLGDPKVLTSPCLAVVGSRNATSYGKKHTNKIAADLAKMGFCIVSGLAYGVDSWAHQASLDYGKSIGVIAGGLDCPLQSWQKGLAKQIIARGGALISESPGKTPALPYHFPLRNRIIAGFGYGTIVIEARQKSGALITAKAALDSNRCVFALPGDVDRPTSMGTLSLITRGAVPIRSAQDVKKELIRQLPPSVLKELPTSDLDLLLEQLAHGKKSATLLAKHLKKPLGQIIANLSELELAGQISKQVDNSYTLNI